MTSLVELCKSLQEKALQNTAESGHLEIVKSLFANRTISKSDYEEAYKKAFFRKHSEIVSFFRHNKMISI